MSASWRTCVRKVGRPPDGPPRSRICAGPGPRDIRLCRARSALLCLQPKLQVRPAVAPVARSVGRRSRSIAAGLELRSQHGFSRGWLLRLPERQAWRSDPGPPAARPQAHGEVRHRRRRPAVRHDGPGREQERRAADPRRQRPHRGRGRSCATSRASATSRRCSRSSARSACEVSWRGPNEVALCAARRARGRDRARARRADPGLVPARRAAARALPPRRHAAARRRRDRPPPPRSRTSTPSARWAPAPTAAARSCSAPPRGCARRDVFMDEPSVMATENALHGRRADPRHDRHRQRRLRAPRPGPRAHAREDGRRHPGHRLEPDHRQRRRAAARLRARRRPRPHRDRQLHGARRRHRRRAAHQGHRPRTTCA